MPRSNPGRRRGRGRGCRRVDFERGIDVDGEAATRMSVDPRPSVHDVRGVGHGDSGSRASAFPIPRGSLRPSAPDPGSSGSARWHISPDTSAVPPPRWGREARRSANFARCGHPAGPAWRVCRPSGRGRRRGGRHPFPETPGRSVRERVPPAARPWAAEWRTRAVACPRRRDRVHPADAARCHEGRTQRSCRSERDLPPREARGAAANFDAAHRADHDRCRRRSSRESIVRPIGERRAEFAHEIVVLRAVGDEEFRHG